MLAGQLKGVSQNDNPFRAPNNNPFYPMPELESSFRGEGNSQLITLVIF